MSLCMLQPGLTCICRLFPHIHTPSISAPPQEAEPQLTSSPDPGLMYDYNGFPPESYSIKYPAPGSPQLAQQAADLLRLVGWTRSMAGAGKRL